MSSKKELVLTVRKESLRDLPQRGYTTFTNDKDFNYYFDNNEVVIGSRTWIENDGNFKQLVNYIVIQHEGKILSFTRNWGGESRLKGKTAIAVGGHCGVIDVIIDDTTSPESINLQSTFLASCVRELYEELSIDILDNDGCVSDVGLSGIITNFGDTPNTVQDVHIGIVVNVVLNDTYNFEKMFESCADEGMTLNEFYTPSTIKHHHDIDAIDLEEWSKILIDQMV